PEGGFRGVIYLSEKLVAEQDLSALARLPNTEEYESQLIVHWSDIKGLASKRYHGFHARVTKTAADGSVLAAIYNEGNSQAENQEPAITSWVSFDESIYDASRSTIRKGAPLNFEGSLFIERTTVDDRKLQIIVPSEAARLFDKGLFPWLSGFGSLSTAT